MNITRDRAMGALMGAFIGEALGVGPHWYYDLDKLRETYGPWIDDYMAPKKGHYHEHLTAGELSQQGWIIQQMARYFVTHEGYEENTFTQWMDEEILPHVSDDALKGIGGYTSQTMRQIYHARKVKNQPWGQIASISDTTESLERNIPTAIYYADDVSTLATIVAQNTALTQSDNLTGSLSVAYNLVLALLIQGEPLDDQISKKLMRLVYKKQLPFFAITEEGLGKPVVGRDVASSQGLFASPDALLSPAHMAQAAVDPDINIEPAWKAAIVYGMPCAIYHMLPSAYYLAARFKDDFESGVLHAINGGGQNQIRALLTGALIGAQVGFSNIPKRFIEGLKEKETLMSLAHELTKHYDT